MAESLSVSAAAGVTGWPSDRLWSDYLSLGGHWTRERFEAYLRDDAEPAAEAEDDLVAQVLNELLAEQGHAGRVADRSHSGPPAMSPAAAPADSSTPLTHPLRVVPSAPDSRVQTSLTRGRDVGHALTCGGCGDVLAWARRLPVVEDVLLRCTACQALNELSSGV